MNRIASTFFSALNTSNDEKLSGKSTQSAQKDSSINKLPIKKLKAF